MLKFNPQQESLGYIYKKTCRFKDRFIFLLKIYNFVLDVTKSKEQLKSQ